jgi:hypothetical protein
MQTALHLAWPAVVKFVEGCAAVLVTPVASMPISLSQKLFESSFRVPTTRKRSRG